MWQKDHPDTYHIVSFVENHNCPLQVNAVCPAALQQEGKGAGLEAGQTGEAPPIPRPPGSTHPPPSWTSGGPLGNTHTARGSGGPTPHQACHTAMAWRMPKAGLGLVFTWGGDEVTWVGSTLVPLCFNCISVQFS